MESANREILAKVKKLLALGESPSEAEAASALEKARNLLARYGLSMADVESHSPDITENVLIEKKRLRAWESHLVSVITECTFTQALHVSRAGVSQVLIIGREVNAVSAAELFGYLHLAVLKLGRAHSAEVAHLESFKMGVVQRIGERLALVSGDEVDGGSGAHRSAQGNAHRTGHGNDGEGPGAEGIASDRQLTVRMAETASRENDAYITEKYGKPRLKRTGRRVDADSYYRGRAAGEDISLNRQIR
jgi:hypothetical protein